MHCSVVRPACRSATGWLAMSCVLMVQYCEERRESINVVTLIYMQSGIADRLRSGGYDGALKLVIAGQQW